jgi:hypothetical protein
VRLAPIVAQSEEDPVLAAGEPSAESGHLAWV